MHRCVVLSSMLFLIVTMNFCNGQQLTSGGKIKPEQAIMDVRHYTIALTVDISQQSISGYTTIDVILSQPAPRLLFDLMNNLQVKAVWINGRKTKFTHEG